MISQDKLQQKAVDDCEQHVASLISGNFFVEPNESGVSWSEIDLRHNFSSHMIIWRRCAEFTVVLDGSDTPVGYIDEDKKRECEWAPLDHDTIVELASQTGFVPADALVLSEDVGPDDCIEARLSTDPEKPDAPRYVVRINPIRRRIISILPEEAS